MLWNLYKTEPNRTEPNRTDLKRVSHTKVQYYLPSGVSENPSRIICLLLSNDTVYLNLAVNFKKSEILCDGGGVASPLWRSSWELWVSLFLLGEFREAHGRASWGDAPLGPAAGRVPLASCRSLVSGPSCGGQLTALSPVLDQLYMYVVPSSGQDPRIYAAVL